MFGDCLRWKIDSCPGTFVAQQSCTMKLHRLCCVSAMGLTVAACCCWQCIGNSRDYVTSTLSFIKSHQLMFDVVRPTSDEPVFFTKNLSFSRIAVDFPNSNAILNLYRKGWNHRFLSESLICITHFDCLTTITVSLFIVYIVLCILLRSPAGH